MIWAQSNRPVIGVTTSAGFTPLWPFLALSVRVCGGRPVRITPRSRRVDLDALDGLIVGGGDDIGAELYGGKPMLNARVDPERDELELSLLSRFWDGAAPILGICRGAQLMNVFRGGSLHDDIHKVFVEAPKMRTILPKKRVTFVSDSALAEITGVNALVVNSLHHQSVDRLGEGLSVSAWDEVGIVQGVEATGPRFRIGVQWHPEYLIYRQPHRALFSRLVGEAKARVVLA